MDTGEVVERILGAIVRCGRCERIVEERILEERIVAVWVRTEWIVSAMSRILKIKERMFTIIFIRCVLYLTSDYFGIRETIYVEPSVFFVAKEHGLRTREVQIERR